MSSLVFTILSFVCVFLFLSRVAALSRRPKLPPGPPALPIIGNLHILGTLPHRSLYRLAQKYGPMMLVYLGRVPTIVVSSPQVAELFLKTHDIVFASRPKMQSTEILYLGAKGMIFTEYGSYWRNVRKLCTMQLLSGSRINIFAPMRKEEIGLLVEEIKEAAAASEVVNLTKMVAERVENMTYRMIFGRSKYDDEFVLKPLIEEALSLIGTFNLADYIPFLAPLDLQGIRKRLKSTSESLHKAVEKIITEHEQESINEGQPKQYKDFVDVLLSMLNEPLNPNEEPLYMVDRAAIKAIMLDMVGASLDTSVNAIDWTLAALLKHPRVMTRVQDELESVIGKNKMVEEKDLGKLPYLDMVIKESLRLYPVAPLLVVRESMKDISINGCYIPNNSRILINAWAIGHDCNVWSNNADEFLPERFMDNHLDVKGRDFELIPFGSGRRSCAGMQLGLLTVKFVVARLVHCFDWKLPGEMLASEVDMTDRYGAVLTRINPLLAVPTYRLHD